MVNLLNHLAVVATKLPNQDLVNKKFQDLDPKPTKLSKKNLFKPKLLGLLPKLNQLQQKLQEKDKKKMVLR